jgi:hypothetical protein
LVFVTEFNQGLFSRITSTEVVAVMTSSVSQEETELLREGQMKLRLVIDHGDANISRYAYRNLEVMGLEIWLSDLKPHWKSSH